MVNTIPIFTESALGVTEAYQVEDKLRAVLRRWIEEVTVNIRDPFEVTADLPEDLLQSLREVPRADAAHGFPVYHGLFSFANAVGHRHHASGSYAKYLLQVDRQLWLLVKLVIEFNRLVRGEETIELTVAQRALILGAVGKLAR